jgi:lipopolysaccharide/colanic/teichoic acid biosynthesis glycosyltransferase
MCIRDRLVLTQEPNALLVIDQNYQRSPAQENFLCTALALGMDWCPLKLYEGYLHGFAKINDIDDLLDWTLAIESKTENEFSLKCKRLARRLVALLSLIILSPTLALIAALICATSGRPIIFKQTRVGFRGRHFTLYKFRTMSLNAESGGPQWSSGESDPRTFPFGAWLRKTHLDELPQLWNVVKGDLCFIGPRPERPEFHAILERSIPHFSARTRVKPGITGWAQLIAGYAASIEDSRRKVEHDIFFIRNSSGNMSFSIVIRTFLKILKELAGAALKKRLRSKLTIEH